MKNKERDEAVIRIFQVYAQNAANCIEMGGFIGPVLHASFYGAAFAALADVLGTETRQDNAQSRTVTIKPISDEERLDASFDALVNAIGAAGFNIETA